MPNELFLALHKCHSNTNKLFRINSSHLRQLLTQIKISTATHAFAKHGSLWNIETIMGIDNNKCITPRNALFIFVSPSFIAFSEKLNWKKYKRRKRLNWREKERGREFLWNGKTTNDFKRIEYSIVSAHISAFVNHLNYDGFFYSSQFFIIFFSSLFISKRSVYRKGKRAAIIYQATCHMETLYTKCN